MSTNNEEIAIRSKKITKVVNDGFKDLIILDEISFSLKHGKSLAILGPSGCGKSTLLGIIAGLDIPTTGSVFWFNEEISKLNEEERALRRNGKLGFVFQSFQLINHLTALENVMLPLELAGLNNAKDTAIEFLEKVKLIDRIKHFPSTMSGGEQQRVALARAFSVNPKLLFVDEPTGSLDHNNGGLIKDLLFDLQSFNKTTLLVVTHDNDLAFRCNDQLKIISGKLVNK